MLDLGKQYTNQTADYYLGLPSRDGTSLAGLFSGAEILRVRLWAGDDRTAVVSLNASWDSSLLGNPASVAVPRVKFTIPASSLTTLPPGRYQVEGIINPGLDDVYFTPPDTTISIVASAGSGTVGKTYCTYQDMIDLVPWIETVQNAGVQSGFQEQREIAREWLEMLIQRHAGAVSNEWGAELGLAGSWGGAVRNKWLQTQLDADLMLVTRTIRRTTAYKALGLVLQSQIGSQGDRTYAALGSQYELMAADLASTLTVEFDVNGDGFGDIAIDLGWVDTLWRGRADRRRYMYSRGFGD